MFTDEIIEKRASWYVRAKTLFGAYGVYCNEKYVVIIGDNTCVVKATNADATLVVDLKVAPPYLEAKD